MTTTIDRCKSFGQIPRPKVWQRTTIRYNFGDRDISHSKTKLCFNAGDGGTAIVVLRKDIKAVSLPRNMAVINLEFTVYYDGIISTIPYPTLNTIKEILRESVGGFGYSPDSYYIQECRNGAFYRFSIFIKLGNKNKSFLRTSTSIVDQIKRLFTPLRDGFISANNNDFIIETVEFYRHKIGGLLCYISFSDWFKIQEGYYPPGYVVKSYRLMPQPDRFNEF